MSFAQLRDLLKARRQLRELPTPAQLLDGAQLIVGCAARSYEVRMICIRQPIRASARRRHNRPLLEEQHGLVCARQREYIGNRLQALRVHDGVTPAVEYSKSHAFVRSQPRQELGALRFSRANLEMWRTRPGQGTAAE